MNKLNKNFLLSLGLIIIVISQIVSHFIKLPDFLNGSFMGIGIGIMILAVIRKKLNPDR